MIYKQELVEYMYVYTLNHPHWSFRIMMNQQNVGLNTIRKVGNRGTGDRRQENEVSRQMV